VVLNPKGNKMKYEVETIDNPYPIPKKELKRAIKHLLEAVEEDSPEYTAAILNPDNLHDKRKWYVWVFCSESIKETQ